MNRFDERIQEIKELRKTLEEGQFFLGYENKLLIMKLLEKHMESLTSMYRGHMQHCIHTAMLIFLYPTTRESEMMAYNFPDAADERRYIDDVVKALKAVRPPDYLPGE